MRAGQLRHRIVIQEPVTSRGPMGDEITTWQDYATLWAAVEPIRGREYFDAQQVQAEVTHRIRIRHHAGITPRMRVVWGSRVWRIEAVLNIEERNREMHLMAVEEVTT